MFERWHKKGEILDRKQVYSGPVYGVQKLHIKTPDGLTVERDLIKCDPTVTILAMTSDQKIVMNSEYRVGINAESVSLPAGIINPGENSLAAAKRELQEETGYVASSVKEMINITSSEGFMDQTCALMLVKFDPKNRVSTHFDHDEFVSSSLVDYSQVMDWIKQGKINTAQTISAVTYFTLFEKNQ